jgi:hypothetical protein
MLVGNFFTASGGVGAFRFDGSTSANLENTILDASNVFATSNITIDSINSAYANRDAILLRHKEYTLSAPGTIGLTDDFGIVTIVSSGAAGGYTINMPTVTGSSANARIYLIYRNTSANTHTLALSNGASPSDAGLTVNAGEIMRIIYCLTQANGTRKWYRMTGITIAAL